MGGCKWILMDMLVLSYGNTKREYFVPIASYRLEYRSHGFCLALSYTQRPDGSQCSHEMSLFLGWRGSFFRNVISFDLTDPVCFNIILPNPQPNRLPV